ncbi:MAG TPA: Gfo/Idh/MocA family oxidoreductase [Gaiellales bacterium]|nr:Gfo/Idh/MocA family oxidoreductase [Gaiellales bacterium]
MRPAIRVAVIGTGFAGGSHVEALRRVPGVEVAVLAGSSDERALAASERLGIAGATGDFRQVLDDPSIAAVHNCTPNDLHHEITGAALEAGKHVLAEKPLAMDSRETADLVARAEAAGTVTGVCFNYRHYPLVAEARAMLADGRAGRPHLIRGTYLQDWLLASTDWNWRLQSERSGASRAVGDIGSHWMDLLQHVTGRRIARVYARLGRLHEERLRPAGASQTFTRDADAGSEPVAVDTEDFAMVLFELDDGCPGVFTVSQVTPGRRNGLTFEIDTGAASLGWDQEHPNELRIGRRDRANEEVLRDPALLSPAAAALAHYPGGHQEGWPDGLKNLFLDFYAAVRARGAGAPHESSVATFADAHRITCAVEAILESHREDRWVDITES